jgi:hypothetical protein
MELLKARKCTQLRQVVKSQDRDVKICKLLQAWQRGTGLGNPLMGFYSYDPCAAAGRMGRRLRCCRCTSFDKLSTTWPSMKPVAGQLKTAELAAALVA